MIEDYRFGQMKIRGENYTSDLKIIGDDVIENWWRRESHYLHYDDITDILNALPDVVVIGTGASEMMVVPKEVIRVLEERGIGVVVQKTGQAVATFNKLKQEGRRVAGAFHLTC